MLPFFKMKASAEIIGRAIAPPRLPPSVRHWSMLYKSYIEKQLQDLSWKKLNYLEKWYPTNWNCECVERTDPCTEAKAVAFTLWQDLTLMQKRYTSSDVSLLQALLLFVHWGAIRLIKQLKKRKQFLKMRESHKNRVLLKRWPPNPWIINLITRSISTFCLTVYHEINIITIMK